MSIVTKTGDQGETSLFSLERVPKSNLRIEALGALDELNAHLAGLGLEDIQSSIFFVGSLIADTRVTSDKQVLMDEIHALERRIFDLEAELPPLSRFILPGGTPEAIRAHEARTICRRAERWVSQIETLPKNILPYLNRLSDFLFLLARDFNVKAGVEDLVWKS